MRSGLPALTRPFSACRIKTFFEKPQTGAISGKVHVFKGLNPNRAENKAEEEVYRPRGSKQKPRITQLRRELLLYKNKISSESFGLHEKMFSMLETQKIGIDQTPLPPFGNANILKASVTATPP